MLIGWELLLMGAVAVVGAIGTPAPAALAACAVTALGTGGVALGLRRFEAWTQPAVPRVVAVGVPGLTSRENDVLTGLAAGRPNAGIAAEVFLSERTVEQHLCSAFDKLGLGGYGVSYRRVRAAAVWWLTRPRTGRGEATTGSAARPR